MSTAAGAPKRIIQRRDPGSQPHGLPSALATPGSAWAAVAAAAPVSPPTARASAQPQQRHGRRKNRRPQGGLLSDLIPSKAIRRSRPRVFGNPTPQPAVPAEPIPQHHSPAPTSWASVAAGAKPQVQPPPVPKRPTQTVHVPKRTQQPPKQAEAEKPTGFAAVAMYRRKLVAMRKEYVKKPAPDPAVKKPKKLTTLQLNILRERVTDWAKEHNTLPADLVQKAVEGGFVTAEEVEGATPDKLEEIVQKIVTHRTPRQMISSVIPKQPKMPRARDYVNHNTSEQLDDYVAEMLACLFFFQERGRFKNPMKAKLGRRLLVGLREVDRSLRAEAIKMLIVVPNIDAGYRDGGLNEKVTTILSMATDQELPIVFALSRRKLGKALLGHRAQSIVGIMSFDGCSGLQHKVIAESNKLKKEFVGEVKSDTVDAEPAAAGAGVGVGAGSAPSVSAKLNPTASAFVPSFVAKPVKVEGSSPLRVNAPEFQPSSMMLPKQ